MVPCILLWEVLLFLVAGNIRQPRVETLLLLGNAITLLGASIWAIFAYSGLIDISYGTLPIVLTLGFIVVLFFGMAIIIPNILGHALENYSHMAGTAASLFGFYYYILVSLITFGIGLIHNGTVMPMPFYFTGLALSMLLVYYFGIRKPKTVLNAT